MAAAPVCYAGRGDRRAGKQGLLSAGGPGLHLERLPALGCEGKMQGDVTGLYALGTSPSL